MFCPKCGSILMPKKEKGKSVMKCSCGHTDKETKTEIKETIEEKEEIHVMQEGELEKSLPLTDEDCPKCKNGKARYWLRQMRAGDEPETRFFKCEECKHTWREY